ncbi:MAG: MFS transporter [Chromatiaceae bacterium]|jgi:Na+/melibiose symporter-like transporter
MPAVPLAFLGLPLYVYLPARYAEQPEIGLATVGAVLLFARLLDLVTDPLVGLLTDRTRARIRPQWLMVLGGLLMLGGASMLFRPDESAGAVFLFTTLTVTYLGWTLLAIPYYALGAELGDSAGQTQVAAWREAGMIAGTLAALLLPVAFGASDTLAFSAGVLLYLIPIALLAAWTVGGHALSGAVKRRASGLRAMWHETSRPARQVLGIHLLNALAGGTAATLFLIFTREALGLDEQAAGLLLLLYFVTGLVALPAWVVAAKRFGEAPVWQAAMLLAALGFLPAAFLGEGDMLAFALVCLATGATLGADIALPAALQARVVVDESRALNKPRGGALFGLWGMASKLALALSAGVALPLLAWLSGPETGRAQGEVVPWLYAGLPVLIKLMAIAALQRSVLMHIERPRPGQPTEGHDAVDATFDSDAAAGATRRL